MARRTKTIALTQRQQSALLAALCYYTECRQEGAPGATHGLAAEIAEGGAIDATHSALTCRELERLYRRIQE